MRWPILATVLVVSGCPKPSDAPATAEAPSAASTSPSPVASTSVSTSTATPAPGSPLSKLVPPARPGARTPCPLTIEPGVAFGPVLLGETLADLVAAGLTVKKTSATHAEVALPGGTTLQVTLCEGKILEVWIDDLRKAPACVEYAGTKVAATIDRPDLEKLLGGCTATPPRTGGAFERCQDGGVYLGHGLGTFVQIRVHPKSIPFDDACEIAKDDGSPVTLTQAQKQKMLESTLLLKELSDHYHVKLPGRDPLRIVKTPLVAEHSLMMFGSDVVWIEESAAKAGTAFLRITGLSATKTKAKLSFEYPIEGVTGSVTFAQRFGEWRYESSDVKEK